MAPKVHSIKPAVQVSSVHASEGMQVSLSCLSLSLSLSLSASNVMHYQGTTI